MNNIKYSFVIPTYNCGEYLERCLDSIFKQKSKYKYEIIVIDDGSTDNTKVLLNSLAKKHLFFLIVTQDRKGVAEARNVGASKANGEYLIFVDADDTINDKFLEMADKYIVKNIDILKMRINVISNKENDQRFDLPLFESKTGQEAISLFCKEEKIFAVAWSYIFKRELFKTIKFPRGMVHEDLAIIPIIINMAQIIVSIDYMGYNYIKRDDSLSMKSDEKSELIRMDDFIFHCYSLINYFIKNNADAAKYFYKRLSIKLNNLNNNINNLKLEKLNNYELIDKCESIISTL